MDFEPTLAHGIIFSDSVIREEGTGKISYIGSFQLLNTVRFPAQFPPFFITSLITNIPSSSEGFSVTARIENPKTGHVLCSSSMEIKFTGIHGNNDDFEMPLPIGPVGFPCAGEYDVIILVNSEKLGSRKLFVRPASSPVGGETR